MKNLFTFLVSMLFVASSFAQTINVLPEFGTGWGGGVEVDINNNGHLDLIFGGRSGESLFLEDEDGNQVETDKLTKVLMFNTETKAFEEKTTNIVNADRANFKVADFNADGIMDVVITDHNRDLFYGAGVYEGLGDGTFELKTLTFDVETYQFRPVAIALADFNNDALVDIVAIGYEKIDEVVTNYSAVLINKGNYEFEVTNAELLVDYELALATVKVLDHNNDGYMDFFVTANCDNPSSNGDARVLADIFENLGEDEPGTFFRLFLGDGVIFQKANGGLDIADFNQDGWMDFAIHGEGGAGTGEPEAGNEWACYSHLYINQKNGLYADKAQASFPADIRPLNSSGVSTRTIDWDGDGSYDIFIPGWNPAPETGTQAGFVVFNDGNAAFGNKTRIPGASEILILFPDWNGDSKRDYFMSGQSWDSEYFEEEDKGRIAAVMLNDKESVNERPSAPTNLTVDAGPSGATLSWDAASDAETGAKALTYEYYLKKDGVLYSSCRSHVGGDLDGVRKVLDHGNAMLNTEITLHNLPKGSYEWGVQAIDASYDGSVFATGTFNVVPTAVNAFDAKDLVDFSLKNQELNIRTKVSADVSVYSISGALVKSQASVDAFHATLNKGAYIVKVKLANQALVHKIIVQ